MVAERWSGAAAVAGCCLGALFGAAALVRRGRPLHPQGRTHAATVQRTGAATGVPWLDESGPASVRVRVSRAMGLPSWLPDIYGMAMRIPLPAADARDGHDDGRRCADLLFASTGERGPARFVLRLRASTGAGPLTTLLPGRAPAGPLLLRLSPLAKAVNDHLSPPPQMSLSYAIGMGEWTPVGTMYIGELVTGHEQERYDPVLHRLPGDQQYQWVDRLREPAYRAARRLGPLVPRRPPAHLPS